MQCPECLNSTPEGSNFCEVCGARLTEPTGATSAPAAENRCRCGAGQEEVDEQGYCTSCGIYRARMIRDHRELRISADFAAITDRGLRHPHNEDDMTIGTAVFESQPGYIAVVCDGLSSAQDSEDAATIAAQTARDALIRFVEAGGGDSEQAISEAIQSAHLAVCGVDYVPSEKKDPPETTIVAALVQQGHATIGWVGDSRAYWVGPEGAGLLTHDHSWVNEVVDAGEMTLEEAMQSRNAHAITRCLGAIAEDGSGPEASITTFNLTAGYRLLLCSDGLWNYASSAEEIQTLMQEKQPEEALETARRLVEFARNAGGHDNITVAILNYPK